MRRRTAPVAMLSSNLSQDSRPSLLSVREREVVDLAVEGCTDEQIAQALDIAISTVNSYWVRIRGKIGQISRTEIVAKMVRAGYADAHAKLDLEIALLKDQLSASETALAGALSQLHASEGVDWHLLALHFASEALLVAQGRGEIVYANLLAERHFGCDPGALVGRAISEITAPDGRERRRIRIREFLEAETPGRLAFGIHEPCFARPQEGEDFRVTVVLEGFVAPCGFMAVVTVKEFLSGVEEIVRTLRKPIVLE